MEPENEINICKFYIKKCCKHGLRGNNCNCPHPAPCTNYIENPEHGYSPECTSYHPDIYKYSMELRKCYYVNCAVRSFAWSTSLKSADPLVGFDRVICEVIGRYVCTTVLRSRSGDKQWFDTSLLPERL